MGIDLGRVLARLEEAGDREGAVLDGDAVLDVLGALAIVDPKRAGCGVRPGGVADLAD
ncbi:hypothetical protein ACPCTN_03335 [Streptomyces cinereoruber]|uniref:hypothetical protein n=1 Tax=Streptomyces cinereoruber TaxID=67260 RepID=UPI003C2D8F47